MNIKTNENFITIDKNEICEKDETPQIYKLIKNKLTFINLKKDIYYDLNCQKKKFYEVTEKTEVTIHKEEAPHKLKLFIYGEIFQLKTITLTIKDQTNNLLPDMIVNFKKTYIFNLDKTEEPLKVFLTINKIPFKVSSVYSNIYTIPNDEYYDETKGEWKKLDFPFEGDPLTIIDYSKLYESYYLISYPTRNVSSIVDNFKYFSFYLYKNNKEIIIINDEDIVFSDNIVDQKKLLINLRKFVYEKNNITYYEKYNFNEDEIFNPKSIDLFKPMVDLKIPIDGITFSA